MEINEMNNSISEEMYPTQFTTPYPENSSRWLALATLLLRTCPLSHRNEVKNDLSAEIPKFLL